MADAAKPRFSPTGCLKKLVLGLKVLLIIVVLIGSGLLGGAIVNQINQNNFQVERDRSTDQERRIGDLVSTIEDLEGKNNELLGENQGLKDQLKTAEQRQLEEERKRQLQFVTKELGRRLMSFQLEKPALYFEFDRSYESAKAVSFPAEFSKDVVAEGIEITFAKSPITIIIEPWKFSGRALEQVEKFTVKTADGKDAQVTILKDDKEQYTINALIINGDKQDNTKLLVTATVNKEQQGTVTEEIRDILRSLELNVTEL